LACSQNEIDRLKKEIQNKKISENAPIEEEEEDEEEQSSAQKVSVRNKRNLLQSNSNSFCMRAIKACEPEGAILSPL
jgi:hypothetical protein